MKAVIQRCLSASVEVDKKIVGDINKGFVVFLGIGKDDSDKDLEYLVRKISGLRIFEDENQKMNKSISQVDGEMLVISNFTLYANTTHGFRPDFINSMMPQRAEEYVNRFVEECRKTNCFKKINTGVFGADMKVKVENDGPVTIIIESEKAK
ncbi:MAG: D-tyrosyl-tRNA(Tyr) deacylase [Clostridia bacterium]|nr:D-tyrosyl-tRNA(Tyr) deacylase [Clostridia bacterium]